VCDPSTIVRMVQISRRGFARVLLLLVGACALPACGAVAAKEAIEEISQEQAADLRDGCVSDALALVTAMADRLAPLARARDIEALTLTAERLGCNLEGTTDGYRLLCPAVELRGATLAMELHLVYGEGVYGEEETELSVRGEDGARQVLGMLTLRDDPERGLVLRGALEATAPDGCRAVAEFDEIIGLEAIELPGDTSRMYFREGAIDLAVYAANAVRLALGSAAMTGRDAFVVLNFPSFSVLGDVALD